VLGRQEQRRVSIIVGGGGSRQPVTQSHRCSISVPCLGISVWQERGKAVVAANNMILGGQEQQSDTGVRDPAEARWSDQELQLGHQHRLQMHLNPKP
jgi:hypothetical protein